MDALDGTRRNVFGLPARRRDRKANRDKRGLVHGINPVGWMADAAHVPVTNVGRTARRWARRSGGFCDGTRFRYALADMGPIAIFDKSALQGLNIDESVWFDAFFLANVVPVFDVETLAGKTPPGRRFSVPDVLASSRAPPRGGLRPTLTGCP